MKKLLKTNKAIMLALSITLIVSIALITFGKIYMDNQVLSFGKGGYIITANEQAESKVHAFENDTKYSKKTSDQFSFTDIQDKEVNVDKESFVFYDDKSVTALTKGVLLNISDISSNKYINHYSIATNLEVASNSRGFEVLSETKKIQAEEMIWKISDSKYLLLAKKININFSEGDKKSVDGFLQINYIDEGVVQLMSKENVWQTVSQSASLSLDSGATVRLFDQLIEANDTQMLFSKLVINADDNVELSPLETKTQVVPKFDITGENGESGNEGNSGNQGVIGGTGPSGNEGDEGDGGNDGEEGKDGEDANFESTFKTQLPTVTINDWEVNASGIKGTYHVEDKNEMMSGNLKIVLYESGSGNEIDCVDEKGISGDDFVPYKDMTFTNSKTLKPDTEYRLSITSDYSMNGIFKREFLSRTFYTDSVGVLISKQYVTTNKIVINVAQQAYSQANSAKIYVLTEEQAKGNFDPLKNKYLSKSVTLEPKVAKETEVIFDESDILGDDSKLKSNQKYLVRLEITNGTTNKQFISEQAIALKTLKVAPTLIGSPVVVANRQSWAFELYGPRVSDPDNAIISYLYQVTCVDPLSAENGKVVREIEVKPSDNIQPTLMYIDGDKIKSGMDYSFKVTTLYNDNEKVIELQSESSPSFRLNGSQLPSVSYQETTVTHESIKGYLAISLNGSKINVNGENPITVHIQCDGIYESVIKITELGTSTDSSPAWISGDQIIIPIDKLGLNEGKLYRLNVEATVDVNTGEAASRRAIGHVAVKTKDMKTLKAQWKETQDTSHRISRSLQFVDNDTNELLGANSIESKTLTSVSVGLYSSSNPDMQLAQKTFSDTNDDKYISSLTDEFITKGTEINEELLDYPASSLTEDSYTLKVTSVYDYTVNETKEDYNISGYVNEYEVNAREEVVTSSIQPPALPAVDKLNEQIVAIPIHNSVAANYGQTTDPKLTADAIIGYELEFKYLNVSKLARNIHVYGFESSKFNSKVEKTKLIYDGDKLLTTGEFDFHGEAKVTKTSHTMPKVAVLFGKTNPVDEYKGIKLLYTNSMSRGYQYTFAYAVEYSSDPAVDSADKIYPYNHPFINTIPPVDQAVYVLNSGTKATPKIQPSFFVYPESQDNNNLIMKYYYIDPDGTVKKDVSTIKSGSDSLGVITVDKEKWGSFSLAIPANNKEVSKKISFSRKLYIPNYDTDTGAQICAIPLSTQGKAINSDFDKTSIKVDTKDLDKNILTVSILGLENNPALRNKVAGLNLIFEAGGKTTELLVSTDADLTTTIPVSKIASLVGKGDISASYEIYYDTGNQGWSYFEKNSYVAIQTYSDVGTTALSKYQVYNTVSNSFEQSSDARGSLFKRISGSFDDASFTTSGTQIQYLASLAMGTVSTTQNAVATMNGMQLTNATNTADRTFAVAKEVATFHTTKKEIITGINKIIPSVASAGYIPNTNSITLNNVNMYGVDYVDTVLGAKNAIIDIKDEKSSKVQTQTLNLDNWKNGDPIVVDGLEKDHTYIISLRASVGGIADTLFLDASSSIGRTWNIRVKTSSSVSISNSSVAFEYVDYTRMNMRLKYSIDQTISIKIKYSIKDNEGNIVYSTKEMEDLGMLREVTAMGSYKQNMDDYIILDVANYGKLIAGNKYKVCIEIFQVDKDGNITDNSLLDKPHERSFEMPSSNEPRPFDDVWMEDGNLVFEFALNDENHVIMSNYKKEPIEKESNYFARIFKIDGENKIDVTPSDVKFKPYKPGTSYRIQLDDVGEYETYQLVLYATIDTNHDGEEDRTNNIDIKGSITSLSENDFEKRKNDLAIYSRTPYVTPNTSGVVLGTQSLGSNPSDNTQILVTYREAVAVNKISRVQYSITSTSGVVGTEILDNRNGTLFGTPSGGYFTLVLPTHLQTTGNYLVTLEYSIKKDDGTYEKIGTYSANYAY